MCCFDLFSLSSKSAGDLLKTVQRSKKQDILLQNPPPLPCYHAQSTHFVLRPRKYDVNEQISDAENRIL
jgi:hypothetical protein